MTAAKIELRKGSNLNSKYQSIPKMSPMRMDVIWFSNKKNNGFSDSNKIRNAPKILTWEHFIYKLLSDI